MTRAGIENGHGNSYVNFVTAHERKIAQRSRGKSNAVQKDLGAGVKTRAENFHAADGRWRRAQSDFHGRAEACGGCEIRIAGIDRGRLNAFNVNSLNSTELEERNTVAARIDGQSQVVDGIDGEGSRNGHIRRCGGSAIRRADCSQAVLASANDGGALQERLIKERDLVQLWIERKIGAT